MHYHHYRHFQWYHFCFLVFLLLCCCRFWNMGETLRTFPSIINANTFTHLHTYCHFCPYTITFTTHIHNVVIYNLPFTIWEWQKVSKRWTLAMTYSKQIHWIRMRLVLSEYINMYIQRTNTPTNEFVYLNSKIIQNCELHSRRWRQQSSK